MLDNFQLKFKEMKTKTCSVVRICTSNFDGNISNLRRKMPLNIGRNKLADASSLKTTGKVDATVHCFVKGLTTIDNILITSGIYPIPDWYLEQEEFIPLDLSLIAPVKPDLQILLSIPILIAEVKVKTCLQKTGQDLYFTLFVKLFSKTVDLQLKIVCLGTNHLYIYTLYHSIMLEKNYIFTNLKSSKFRVENTSEYYSAYLISTSTEILLLTIPLLRELRPLMHLYDPKVDKKFESVGITGLYSFKGVITKVGKDYYELNGITRYAISLI